MKEHLNVNKWQTEEAVYMFTAVYMDCLRPSRFKNKTISTFHW